jgi:tRNA threonylcarbamoyladenosine biosynthesis protein TsaE
LIQEYRGGRSPMFHVDLYRLRDDDDLQTLGLEDVLAAGAVVVVEWGEKLPPYYRRDVITVRFHDVGEGSRRIELVLPPPADRGRGGNA